MEVPIARHLGSPQDIYRNMREEAVDAINTRGNGGWYPQKRRGR